MSHSNSTPPDSISKAAEGSSANVEAARCRVTLVRVGELFIGIALESVSEVVVPRGITNLPGASLPVVGLANVKGRIVSIIDLAHALGVEIAGGDDARLVVLVHRGAQVALLVPEVVGIFEAELGPAVGSGASSPLTAGEFQAEEKVGKLLDPDRLLNRFFR